MNYSPKTLLPWAATAVYCSLSMLISRPVAAVETAEPPAPTRWENDIREFEKQDALQPPKKHGILFVGSSSIRLWDLKKSFPDLPVVNRGFGGSQVADSLFYADRIILPHEPRVVAVYAGDNDIAAGSNAETVLHHFQKLVAKIHVDLPNTAVIFIAIKPSIKRWHLKEEMAKANQLIRDYAEAGQNVYFVDIYQPMLGKDRRPRENLFVADGLHLNETGYTLWTRILRKKLDEVLEKISKTDGLPLAQ